MKIKNKIKKIEIIFLLLILIPFISGVDFDGDGIDDGEQDLCGDAFCQEWETESNCPKDCQGVSSGEQSLSSQEEQLIPSEELLSPSNNTIEPSNQLNDSTLQEEVDNLEDEEFLNSTEENLNNNLFLPNFIFKIIFGLIVLTIISIIIYIIIRKKKNKDLQPNHLNSEVSNS
jgi:hypothetical protein